jgi:hypothetical protein
MKSKSFSNDQVKIILDYIDKKTAPIDQLVTKNEIKHLPTKNEFFSKMDEVMGELKTIRENQEVASEIQARHTDILDNHSKRLKKLETHCFTS